MLKNAISQAASIPLNRTAPTGQGPECHADEGTNSTCYTGTMRPRIALTMGDVAGIGPEVIVRALEDPGLWQHCWPIVIGHPAVLLRAVRTLGVDRKVQSFGLDLIASPADDDST